MSVQAMAAAFALEIESPTVKLVLLGLANYADARGRCFPSQRTISEITSLSERSVRGAIEVLERDGLVRRMERRREDGSRATDLIDLVFLQPANAAGSDDVVYKLRPKEPTNRQMAPEQPAAPAGPTTFEPSPRNQDSSLRSESSCAGTRPMPIEPDIDDELAPEEREAELLVPEVVDAEFVDLAPAQLALVVPEPVERFTRPEVMRLWNEMAERCNLSTIREVTDARWKATKARCGKRGLEAWVDLLSRVEASALLQGRRGRGWKCDFDWVLKPANWQKIIEDRYDDRHTGGSGTGSRAPSDFDRRVQQMVGGAALALDRIEKRRQGRG